MLAVLLDTFSYRLMAMIHILTAIVAFGPLFLYPNVRKSGDTATLASMHMRMTFPALILMWVVGMGMAGMSEDAYELSQLWLTLSILNWVVLVAVSWFLIRPAINDTSESAVARLAAGTGITHLGLVVGLVLMIWKPGL